LQGNICPKQADNGSKHADFYDLPDDTRYHASANSSDQKIKLLGQVTIDHSEHSQHTISQILNLEGTGTQCINQKAPLTSDKEVLFPNWETGLEPGGETLTCEYVTIKLSTSLPILEGCLTATCDKWENGKSISSIDTGHASIEHRAKIDLDLARPPCGGHPATQQASPGVLTQSAARRRRSAARHAHSSPSDSE
jgi:hypothetical protein